MTMSYVFRSLFLELNARDPRAEIHAYSRNDAKRDVKKKETKRTSILSTRVPNGHASVKRATDIKNTTAKSRYNIDGFVRIRVYCISRFVYRFACVRGPNGNNTGVTSAYAPTYTHSNRTSIRVITEFRRAEKEKNKL